MSDNLEKFIRTNRREFDTENPSSSVWEKIEATIPVKKQAKRFSLRDIYKWSAAAAIVFIALTSVYFLVIRKNSHDGSRTNDPVAKVNHDETKRMNPDHAEEFKAVYRSIGERQILLKSVTADKPVLYRQFQEDLRVLDSSYQVLKKQAEISPNRDLITEAMIQNLHLQAELLARQLMISNQINNNEKKSNNETRI